MQYTVILNEKSYDLPKKTMRVMEKMEAVIKNDQKKTIGLRDKFRAAHDFVSECLGKENAKEVFGTDDLDEMDLSDITLAFNMIHDAYEDPVRNYQIDKMRNGMSNLPIDKVTNLVNAAEKMGLKNA